MMPDRQGDWRRKPRRKRVIKLPETERHSEQISFSCKPDLREQLIALSYLRGRGGAYGTIARELLGREVRRYIAVELDPTEKGEYETILKSVQTQELVSRMERQEQEHRKIEEENAATVESETELIMGDEDSPGGR